MKLSLFFLCAIPMFAIIACGEKRTNNSARQQSNTVDTAGQECYVAVFDQDTAYLNFNATDKKNVLGRLLINYGNNPKNDGEFKGTFRGDTLIADYTYTVGTYKERILRNPLAFLRRNDSLFLGIGEIETLAGRPYFKPGSPINFDKGRFRFAKGSCRQ
ncbi:hypothetical protein [Desertivirga brevis]|uniref:hypothetical protein n=1 Tax=Desertivirga brevis TaxID=2810310 RepID=UPI001A95C00F|nr:hypothetical protein [Pedobacter sp. SYSU D00873]